MSARPERAPIGTDNPVEEQQIETLRAEAKAQTASSAAGISGLQSQVDAINTAMTAKAASSHTHSIANVTGLQSALDGKQAVIAAGASISDASDDAAADASTGLSGVLLTDLTAEVNAANAKQNALATKYNDLAGKFNTLLSRLETQGLLTP